MSKVYYLAVLNEKDFNLHYVNADSVNQECMWFKDKNDTEGIIYSILNACANNSSLN